MWINSDLILAIDSFRDTSFVTPQAILSTWKDRSRPIGQKAVYYRLFSGQNVTFTSPASFSIGYGSVTCFTFQAPFKRPLFFPAAAIRSRSGKSPVKKTGLCVCRQRKNKNKLFGSFILKMAFENEKSFLSFFGTVFPLFLTKIRPPQIVFPS